MSDEDRLDRGEQALAEGEFQAAIIDAKDVLRSEPRNVRGRVLLGRASLAAGDPAGAEKEFRRALELGAPIGQIVVPMARSILAQNRSQDVIDEIDVTLAASDNDATELELIRAEALLRLRELNDAKAVYDRVLQNSPNNITAMLGLASIYRARNEYDRTRAALGGVTEAFPDEPRAWQMLGELDFGHRDFAAAAESFEKARALSSNLGNKEAMLNALVGIAEAQFALADIDSAKESARQIAEMAPNSLQSLFMTARIAYFDGDWRLAQENLQRILQAVPNYQPAQALIGAVHLRSGNLSQAEMYLSSVVAAAPENSDARRMLAETRFLMRKTAEAEETLAPLLTEGQSDPGALAMAARVRFLQGDSDTAIDYLRRLVEQNPDNIDRKFDLAIALLNSGGADEFQAVMESIDPGDDAIGAFRRDLIEAMSTLRYGGLDAASNAAEELVEKWPKNANAQNFLGSVQLAKKDFQGGRSSFEKALSLDPGNLTAQRSLAAIDENQGRIDEARARYETALASQPNASWAMFGLARIAAQNEDLDKAREWLERIRDTDPNAVTPRATLASIMIDQREFAEAEAVLKEALDVSAGSAALQYLLGQSRSGLTDHAGAAAAYQRAVDLEPENDDYRVALARSQQLSGDPRAAELTLLRGSSVNLDHMPSAVMYVVLKLQNGEFGDAMQIAQSLQRRHTSNPVPLALQAEIQATQGDLSAASETYDRALAIDVIRNHALRAHRIKTEISSEDRRAPLEAYLEERPLDAVMRMMLAESLQRDNLLQEAIREYELLAEQEPSSGVVLNNLAWNYYLVGDSRAEDTAKKAVELMPDAGAVMDTLGWILVETGKVEQGLDVLKEAVELTNGRAEIRYHYAVALSKSGKTEQARRVLEDIIGSDESFASREEAKRLLASL